MTQPDYDQKKRECFVKFCKDNGIDQEVNISIFDAFDQIFDRAYALGKQEKDAEDDRTLKVNRQLFCQLCANADDYINEHLEEEDSDYTYYQGRSDALHELYRGECKDADETVISGWVARDKDDDVFLYQNQPDRNEIAWNGYMMHSLPTDSFPDLTWESEPLPVEIILKRKKK